MTGFVFAKINRVEKEIIEDFKKIPISIVSDALGRNNTMHAAIKPLKKDWKIAGPAITVKAMVGNNLGTHQALYLAQEGDIIVIDGNGFENISLWGAIMSEVAQERKIQGIIIDGSIRDYKESIDFDIPIFCRNVTPRGPHKGWGDDINVPISCGGVPVLPGDLILADEDGIVVVHKKMASEILKIAQKKLVAEKEWISEVRKGKTTLEAIGLDKNVEFFKIKTRDEAFDD